MTALSDNFIIYDYENPSPLFSEEQVDAIEAPREFLNDDELKKLRRFEEWVLNTNTGYLNSPGVTGLRQKRGHGHCYVRRYSDLPFETMVDNIFNYVPNDFPLECVGNGHIPLIRITTPDGEKYYPFLFHGAALKQWPSRLAAAAAHYGTDTACFDRGKFKTSTGKVFDFGALHIERTRRVGKGW